MVYRERAGQSYGMLGAIQHRADGMTGKQGPISHTLFLIETPQLVSGEACVAGFRVRGKD